MNSQTMAIVLSAGMGKRMNSSIPKQYLKIGEKEVLYYTLKAFEYSDIDEIILVTGKDDIEFCKDQIIEKNGFKKVTKVIEGGDERYGSVLNGLSVIDETEKSKQTKYVLIHDGARPCINIDVINNIIKIVKQKKACIVAVRAKDTIKVVEKGTIVDSPRRDTIWQAQTPQAFEFRGIYSAYKNLVNDGKIDLSCITDDASVWSLYNDAPVTIYEGEYSNIKITTPEDIDIVKKRLL